MTVALLITGQEAEWHGINHSFVSLSWHIKLESSGGPDDGARDGRASRKNLNNDASLPHHFGD